MKRVEHDALANPRQRVVGTRETLKKISQGAALRVYVAQDAQAVRVREIVRQCELRQIPLTYIDSMAELGKLCGIEVGAACAAVVPGRP